MTVSKRENCTAVWEALSTYEKAAIRKLALLKTRIEIGYYDKALRKLSR